MSDSKRTAVSSSNQNNLQPEKGRGSTIFLSLTLLLPIVAAIIAYQLDSFDAAPFPLHELSEQPDLPPLRNAHILKGAEFVGVGKLDGPEDIAYDSESDVIYTGCQDGWIKRVRLSESANDSVVEDWVQTGGRPLGLVLGRNNELIVADAYKGLLNISKDGDIELLTDEAQGLKFKLTDGVDVAEDGMIYFTDASYKYYLHQSSIDIYESRPYGRLLSFDPVSRQTRVLLSDLYFANGVAISPDQNHLVFCETPLKRCRKYYIHGDKKGRVEKFVDLVGVPDNIRYDGEGHYWIGIPTEISTFWDMAFKYPWVRKVAAIVERRFGKVSSEQNAGVVMVDLEGKAVAEYRDIELKMITAGIKIKNHLYCGTLSSPCIIRLALDQHPAVPVSTS